VIYESEKARKSGLLIPDYMIKRGLVQKENESLVVLKGGRQNRQRGGFSRRIDYQNERSP